MTCEDCLGGIGDTLTQIQDPAIIAFLTEFLQGEAFCATQEDIVAYVLLNGIPLLVGAADPADLPALCNQAVEGTCPARRIRTL